MCILDAAGYFGGQALQSNAIENYPLPVGYPHGVTGMELMGGFAAQAAKFETQLFTPVLATKLEKTATGSLIVRTDDFSTYSARAVIVSNGLSYRRLNADGLGALMGHGVHYGMPHGASLRHLKHAVIVGGANSAGQACIKLASNSRTKVTMLVRSSLEKGMSSYLIDRIREAPNVTVVEGDEVQSVKPGSAGNLQWVSTTKALYAADGLFIFIGATPRTAWLDGEVSLDENRYILTGSNAAKGWCPGPFATSLEGVWAVGDVRAGSVKRIASAIGEGAGVVPNIHRWLESH